MTEITLDIYRADSKKKYKRSLYKFDRKKAGAMILDLLIYVKENIDSSITFRKSCREGVCGSCAMNINGVNTLACIKSLDLNEDKITINPLPNRPIIRDLVVDLKKLYEQYKNIKPWLQNNNDKKINDKENIQTQEQRQKLDGLWECVLCFCCSSSCPSYWWNEDNYLGPANLLQTYRWISDSRDMATEKRLNELDDNFKLYKCHGIMNCTNACPKGLNPAKAIANIKKEIIS
jgi:succinate dehydrogenase / fumarate reductase, iron-sulfur subunit